jgi:hypothetical protein
MTHATTQFGADTYLPMRGAYWATTLATDDQLLGLISVANRADAELRLQREDGTEWLAGQIVGIRPAESPESIDRFWSDALGMPDLGRQRIATPHVMLFIHSALTAINRLKRLKASRELLDCDFESDDDEEAV